jgi:hypothetical protein
MKMATQISHNPTISIPRYLKVVCIIVGVGALVVLVAVIANLSEQTDFAPFIRVLGEVRVTPGWPQIGLFPIPTP